MCAFKIKMLLVVYLLKCNGESLQTRGVKKKNYMKKKKIYIYDIYHIKKKTEKNNNCIT